MGTTLLPNVTPAVLDFGWSNQDGTQTLYITSDPGQNVITVTLSNNTPGAITFPAGTPVAIGELPEDQSALYLLFNGLVLNSDVQAMTWAAAGWAAATFFDESNGQYLVIAPEADTVVEQGGSLSFSLTQVMTSVQPIGGNVHFQYVGVTDIDPPTYGVQVFVDVVPPPQPENQELELPLQVGFANRRDVFTGESAHNTLVLVLTNPRAQPLVPGGTDSWGDTPPTFLLKFIYGDSSGALTTTEHGNGISVNLKESYGNVWKPPRKELQGDAPYWVLQPDPNGGGKVLGAGAHASVSFELSDIVAEVPGVTLAVLSYSHIPGFRDGSFAIEIVKRESVEVLSLQASPASIPNPTGPTAVTLSFKVKNASYVTLTNTGYSKQVVGDMLQDTVQVFIDTTTTFTLLATHSESASAVTQAITVPVTPDVYTLMPKGTIIMWSGSVHDIPGGWHLCDGAVINGLTVPDLRDRFILGAGGTVAPDSGRKGNADTHTHQVNVGPLSGKTSTTGNHKHKMTFKWTGYMSSGKTSHYGLLYGPDFGGGRGEKGTHSQDTSSKGDHAHTVSVPAVKVTSTTQTGGIKPPWYSLAFIIKTF